VGNTTVGNIDLEIARILRFCNSHLADRFANCGTDFVVLECKNCKKLHTFSLNCGLRICKVCTEKRYSKLRKRYGALIRAKNPRQLSLLTLTIKNVQTLDSNTIHNLIENFVTFRRRRYVQKRLKGGLWCIEIKGSKGNFNLHIHIIIESKWFGRPTKSEISNISIPERLTTTKGVSSKEDLLNYTGKDIGQIMLSAIWEEIAGDPVVDIRRVRSGKEALKYVLKYVTKPPNLETPEDFVEFLFAFFSIPMLKLFGAWYNAVVLVKPRLMCLACGGTYFTVIMFSWCWQWRHYQSVESILESVRA